MKRFPTIFWGLVLSAALFGSCLIGTAATEQTTLVLEADAENLIFSGDTTVDLNGHSLSGVTVTDGTLYLLDTQTDDYTVADGVYGKVTGITGAVKAAEGYLQVTEDSGISFHKVALEVTDMTLRAASAGVYYKCSFSGDELVADRVESYGVALSISGEPAAESLETHCKTSVFTDFAPGAAQNSGSSTLLKGIMKENNRQQTNAQNAQTVVYASAYIKTAEGYLLGSPVQRSLRQQVELIDGAWDTLTGEQQAAVLELYGKYAAVMDSWNIPNILRQVTPADRFGIKLPYTDQFLYRVGNLNAVALGSLFTRLDTEAVEKVTVTVTGLLDESTADFYTFTENGDWTKAALDFADTFTGPVCVTLAAEGVNPVSLNLQVVNAKNITKAESATANDVVLLNDISGTFLVTNGHTFHGNGFTVTLPKDSIQKASSGYTGYISIGAAQDSSAANGGHLDNVRIEGPVFPEMYLYRDQAIIEDPEDPQYDADIPRARYFRNSVIVYGGNVTISNCYISGSRTALCLRGGNNVTIENTTLSGGAYANMQICAGSTVTMRNLTTVQVDRQDSYGLGKTAHGMGIAVDSDVVELSIEGELTQRNWVSASKWDEMIPDAYESSFPAIYTNEKYSHYWHYAEGSDEPYVNLAFVFACNWDKTRIHDNRAEIDYETCDSTIAGVSGGVYTKVNTIGGNTITAGDLEEPDYVPAGFNPIAPKLIFDNSPNHDEDDPEDPNDSYCVYDETTGTVKVGVVSGKVTLDLSGVQVVKDGQALERMIYLGLPIHTETVTVNPSVSKKQTLTIKVTVTDVGYDINGQPIEGSMDYSWKVTVESALLSYPAPAWNMDSFQFDAKDACLYAYYASTNGYGEANPIYEGIKIDYYNKSGELVQLDLSGTTTLPTAADTSNATAFTYKLSDGSVLTMQFAGGWKSGATTHQFTSYNGKVYIYPEALDNDNYVRAKTTNQDFDVKISYTFTDPNGQTSATQTVRWYNPKAENGSIPTVKWTTFDTVNGKDSCFTADTLITLADGSQKRIDQLTFDDTILVWDFFTGTYTEQSVSLLVNHGEGVYRVANLRFDDGTALRIIGDHGVFDYDLNRFVYLSTENMEQYVGHRFVQQGEDGYKVVTLTEAFETEEVTSAWSVSSAVTSNAFASGMLTVAPPEDFYNWIQMDGKLHYDVAAFQKDVEACGLYSYEVFADFVTYEQFVAFNGAYLKIPVEKGLFTFEYVLELIRLYSRWMPQ